MHKLWTVLVIYSYILKLFGFEKKSCLEYSLVWCNKYIVNQTLITVAISQFEKARNI